MSDFLQRFLREDSGAKPALCLAAFGKHPGWNDHLEDFGLETESLASVKKHLYHQGIASQVDSAAWDSLPPEKQLASFNHLLLWTRRTGCIAANLWSSQDGKGRAKYPMVICVHVMGAPASWAVEHVFPVLDELKASCQSATSASEVVRVLTAARDRLRTALPQAAISPTEDVFPPPPKTSDLALRRVLYEVRSQMTALAPGQVETRSPLPVSSRRLRIPASPADAAALLAWTRFAGSQLAANLPLLAIAARDADLIDIIASEPSSADFFCLRASARQLPPTTEIPYTLEPSFVNDADLILNDMRAGRDNERSIFGSRPKSSGFTLFPWSIPGTGASIPPAPAPVRPQNAPPLLPAEKTHHSVRWLQIVFAVLGLAVIGGTLYFAMHRP